MSPTRRQILAGVAAMALPAVGGTAAAITPEFTDPVSRAEDGLVAPGAPFEPVVLYVFGTVGANAPFEHVTLRLELMPCGRLDTCGISEEDFQVPAAGPNETFTPAEFVQRLIDVNRNPSLDEEIEMFPGVDWDALAEED